MASRNVLDLLPNLAEAAEEHKDRCAPDGIDLLIYCTLRDAAEQAKLFCSGREVEQIARRCARINAAGYPQLASLLDGSEPLSGRRVTYAGPGESYHQYGLAYDCVPIVGGKCVWRTTGDDAALWAAVGKHGKLSGLEWAGEWPRFREFAHFQQTGGQGIPELMGTYYGKNEPAALTRADLVREESESKKFREALNEVETKFFVLASVAQQSILERIFEDAKIAVNLNPASRRIFWVRRPQELDADLAELLCDDAAPFPATVLSRGTGMDRHATTFTVADLPTFAKVSLAFSWEP